MSKPQVLIDSNIIDMFIIGSDEQRKVIAQLYPMLNIDALETELLFRIFRDHANNTKRVYPVNYKGKLMKFAVTVLEEDLT